MTGGEGEGGRKKSKHLFKLEIIKMAAREKMMVEGKKGRAGLSLRLLELNRTGNFEVYLTCFVFYVE